MAVAQADCAGSGGGVGGSGIFCSFSSLTVEKENIEPLVTVKEEEEEEEEVQATTFENSSGGGPASSSSSIPTLATIKEEEEEEDAVDDEVDGGSSSGALPKPMEGLNEVGPPPFLRKLYEMVEDRETDLVVSWSLSRSSFIVWDSHDFSENFLPKYFKHKNLSSFIRQLNTYGFRKIHSDRWEFAHEKFQGGKKHLLKNIKRRSRFHKPQYGRVTCVDSNKFGVEVEVESLKNDQDTLRLEILKLRQHQEDSLSQMRAAAERIRCAECKQQQMLNFFAKIVKHPNFVQQLIRKRKQQKELAEAELEFSKKQRLIAIQEPQSLPEPVDTGKNVNCRNQAQEQLASMQSELTDMLPRNSTNIADTSDKAPFQALMDDDFCRSPIQDLTGNVMCGNGTRDSQESSSVYNTLVRNLLGDSSVAENGTEDERVAVDDTRLFHELEDLIGKPHSWAGYVNELVEQVGCAGSIF